MSGTCLTTLPHNHIVRTVDISESCQYILTGGNEKKLRLWDLSKAPADGTEASPTEGVLEFKNGAEPAHAGTIKSAMFDEKRNAVVSMGEDMVVR